MSAEDSMRRESGGDQKENEELSYLEVRHERGRRKEGTRFRLKKRGRES